MFDRVVSRVVGVNLTCFELYNLMAWSDRFRDRVVGINCICFEDSNFRGILSRHLLTKKHAGKKAVT